MYMHIGIKKLTSSCMISFLNTKDYKGLETFNLYHFYKLSILVLETWIHNHMTESKISK